MKGRLNDVLACKHSGFKLKDVRSVGAPHQLAFAIHDYLTLKNENSFLGWFVPSLYPNYYRCFLQIAFHFSLVKLLN